MKRKPNICVTRGIVPKKMAIAKENVDNLIEVK
jgi:hypothetical protein